MMNQTTFRKKYLGEVTLKNGEHVKFLFPITEWDLSQVKIETKNIWLRMKKNKSEVCEFAWALIDELDLQQFQVVYAATKKYGKNYWKIVWEHYLEQNKKN